MSILVKQAATCSNLLLEKAYPGVCVNFCETALALSTKHTLLKHYAFIANSLRIFAQISKKITLLDIMDGFEVSEELSPA